MTTVRISLARFDPDRLETVRGLLEDSRRTLEPAIRELPGLISYHVGIDAETSSMTNASVWATREDAERMASLPAMRELAATFIEVGVRFERPITNHEELWSIGPS